MMYDTQKLCASGLAVIETEAMAIHTLAQRLDEKFASACRLLLDCQGRIIVVGIGKSGHIANKIAATLASTGSPAFFVHPAEASHGDLGMITRQDVVLILSNSGETPEILLLLPIFKRLGLPLICLTGKPQSTLAKSADVALDVSVPLEACPLGLAPTSSTTAALVMGDALAITLLEARGFTAEDFAFSHPGGILGQKLLLRIEDIMHKGDQIPKVTPDTVLSQALIEISNKGLGMTTVTTEQGELLGIFTDGDLRRALDNDLDIHTTPISQLMTVNCKTIQSDILAAEALQQMEKYKIAVLLVTDQQRRLIGVIHMLDLLRAGVA